MSALSKECLVLTFFSKKFQTESFKFAQKKRLKALASKFSNYEEEDSDAIKPILAQASATGSPYKKDLTKTVDVDQIINRNAPATGQRLDQTCPDVGFKQ